MYPFQYNNSIAGGIPSIPTFCGIIPTKSNPVHAEHELTNSLDQRLDSVKDMLQMSINASVNSKNFGQDFHNFSAGFNSISQNANQLMLTMKWPDFKKVSCPRPTDANCWNNINNDCEEILGVDPYPITWNQGYPSYNYDGGNIWNAQTARNLMLPSLQSTVCSNGTTTTPISNSYNPTIFGNSGPYFTHLERTESRRDSRVKEVHSSIPRITGDLALDNPGSIFEVEFLQI